MSRLYPITFIERTGNQIRSSAALSAPKKARYQRPAVYQDGWYIVATRMFRHAKGRAALLVYTTIK